MCHSKWRMDFHRCFRERRRYQRLVMVIDTSRKRTDRCCRPQALAGQEAVTRPVRAASYGGGMRRLKNKPCLRVTGLCCQTSVSKHREFTSTQTLVALILDFIYSPRHFRSQTLRASHQNIFHQCPAPFWLCQLNFVSEYGSTTSKDLLSEGPIPRENDTGTLKEHVLTPKMSNVALWRSKVYC